MRILTLLLVLLFSLPVFSQKQSNTWVYGGFDLGVGSQKSDDFNEEDTTNGRYFGVQLMGQYRFDQVNLEAGIGWLDYKVSTDFQTGPNSRVRLHTKAPYLHTGVFYKLTEKFSLGMVGNYVLDDGLLISAKDKSSLLAGLGAYYSLSSSESMDVRVGAVAQKSIDFLNRDVTLVGINLQIGMPVGSAPAPVLKKNQVVKSQGVIQTKKEITLVSFDETLINFETDSYTLDMESKALLADLGAFMVSNKDMWESLHIEGHTDLRGSDDYNNVLSVRRANSVYEALTTLAIDKSRLDFEGSGKKKPLDPTVSDEAFAKNRRVDLKFVNVTNKNYFNQFITKLKAKYKRNK
jgi:outer membrane protein OmpA-like peptidoglycan-associated protein